MKNIENCKKGQELILSRKTFNGKMEDVAVKFVRAHASDKGRCWVSINGKEWRVAVSKLTLKSEEVPAYVKYGEAEEPQLGNSEKNKIENPVKKPKVSKAIQNKLDEISGSQKVETVIKGKRIKKKNVDKKIVDTTKDSGVKKLERVVKYFAQNQSAGRKEISEAVNCNINYCGIIRGIVKLYGDGMNEEQILSKYAWLTENKMSQIANLYNSYTNGQAK